MKDNNQTKKLPGFYIALCLCVLAVGGAGFIAQKSSESRATTALTKVTETESPTSLPVTTPVPTAKHVVGGAGENKAETDERHLTITPQPTVAAAETSEQSDSSEPADEAVSVKEDTKESVFSPPLADMNIVYGYSGETLLYNDAYGDWRTHDGIDIAASEGEKVTAAADGIVKSVGEGSCGKQVVISHDNNLNTIYAQLEEISVNEGDKITKGSPVGKVGKSIGETVREPHLHYEIRIDGKPQDPASY